MNILIKEEEYILLYLTAESAILIEVSQFKEELEYHTI